MVEENFVTKYSTPLKREHLLIKESHKKSGYPVRFFGVPVKRYCQVLDITDNPLMIELYKECHSPSKAWPEIRKGIREVGILEMEMYIHKNRVFMIVETEPDFDWDSSMERLSKLPRQAEWEAFVAKFQGCDPLSSSTEKWTLMERMFYLYDD